MALFLIPLLVGFTFNSISAFTAAFSRRWGERRGTWATVVLRDVLGIPVWALGVVLAFRASSPFVFTPSSVFRILGIALISVGAVIIIVALISIRVRAAAPSTHDALVQSGLYGLIRHPIHAGTILEFVGLWLIKPTVTVSAAGVLGILWILVQSRLEERDLVLRLTSYREYMSRVPRFVPRLRSRRPA
jgi:protein-S-isoprenylcysteine O-methyltransferase Ste14